MKAFTLIEILIVVSIILVISAVGIDIYSSSRKNLVTDLESDKLVSMLHTIREEAKSSSPSKCVGIKLAKNENPQKIESPYLSAQKACSDSINTAPMSWNSEAVISEIAVDDSQKKYLSVLFSPPFGEMQFLGGNGATAQLTVAFKANTQYFKKISINKASGRFEKL